MVVFSALLSFGAMLGLVWITLESPKAEREIFLNAGFLALFGALIGGRVAYVAGNWDHFQDHLIEIPLLWFGGFSWPGALAGGILGAFLASRILKIRYRKLADRLLPLLASLSVAIWLGCWITGCGYGMEVNWGLPAKNEWGIWKQRLPVQLIGAILTVALFWCIEQFRNQMRSKIPGLAASLGLCGIALILLVTSLLRVDPYPQYYGIRLETWAAIFFLGVAIIHGGLSFLINRR